MNPLGAVAVVVTFHPHRRRTQSMNRRLNPLSAITSRSRGSRWRNWLRSHRPPSRSWTSAVVTHNAQISPSESTSTNRLRPLTFFPPVVPAVAGRASGLHRLAVDPPGGRLGRVSGLDPDVLAEAVVDPLPQPGLPPRGEVVEHCLVVGEVVREQLPRRPAPQVVEDRIDDLSAVGGRPPALAGAALRLGDQRLQPLPLGVRQVGRVRLACHARTDNRTPVARRARFSDAL